MIPTVTQALPHRKYCHIISLLSPHKSALNMLFRPPFPQPHTQTLSSNISTIPRSLLPRLGPGQPCPDHAH